MERKSRSERCSNKGTYKWDGKEVIFLPDPDDDFTSSDEKKTVSQSAFNETKSTGTERSQDLKGAISGLATKKDLEKVAGRLTAVEDIKSTVDGLLRHEDFERTVGRLATQEELKKAVGRLSAVEDIKSTVDGLLRHEEFERTVGRLATQEELKKAVGRLSAVEDIKSTVDGLLKHEDFERTIGRLATQEELKKTVGRLSAVEDIKNTISGLPTRTDFNTAIAGLPKHKDLEKAIEDLATQEDFNAAIGDLSNQISSMKDGADEEIKNAVQNGMVDFAKIGLLSVAQEELRNGILQALSPEGSITIAAKDQVQEGIKYYDETLLSIITTLDAVKKGLQTVDNNINDHSTQIYKNIESGTAQADKSINALSAHIDKKIDTCYTQIEKHSDACVTQVDKYMDTCVKQLNKHIDDCCEQADKHLENCNAHIADNKAKLESISEKLDVNRSKKKLWGHSSALNISYVAICIFCCLLAGIGYFKGIAHTQLLIVALLLATIPLLVVFLSNVGAWIYNEVKNNLTEDEQNDKLQSSKIQAKKCGIVRIVYHSVCCAMALANVVLACLVICEIGGLNLVV